ncbi:MAG: hypothetical protein PHQ00_07160 [Phycisphaerae bacterium]|nr:hypothetical protein [Phycisphaerae bacterium]
MARNTRHIAFYEIINKTRFKSAQQKALDRVGFVKAPAEPEKKAEAVSQAQTEPVKTEAAKPSRPEFVWSARPKTLRLYPDRLELCLTWQAAAITLLAFLATLLILFRLGQTYSIKKSQEIKAERTAVPVEAVMPEKTIPAAVEPTVTTQSPPRMVEPMGDNAIVITSYNLRSHLEPVKQYFAQFGIATEIIQRGSRYLLVTQNRFDSIDKAGSDGYVMKRKIISVGANYKPPAGSGFESFGTKPFQDVYGMKIN